MRTRLQQQSGMSEADLGLLWTPGPGVEITKRVTMSVSEERVILIRIFCPQCLLRRSKTLFMSRDTTVPVSANAQYTLANSMACCLVR